MTFALIGAVLALGGAACGGEEGRPLTKAEYEPTLRREGIALNRAFREARKAPRDPKSIGLLAERIDTSADNLDELNPPKEVEAPHDALVDALRATADGLEDVKKATEGGDPAEIRVANNRLEPVSKRALQAIKQLRGSGYDVGPLGQR